MRKLTSFGINVAAASFLNLIPLKFSIEQVQVLILFTPVTPVERLDEIILNR
jgi:hypothetical protein